MGGTECNYIVSHNGKLWAGLSCWKHDMSAAPLLGPQVLVKHAANADWELDFCFGPDYGTTKILTLSDIYHRSSRREVVCPRISAHSGCNAMASAVRFGIGPVMMYRTNGREPSSLPNSRAIRFTRRDSLPKSG